MGGGKKRSRRPDGDELLEQCRERIKSSTFRALNEQIYTTPSTIASQLLRSKKTFEAYHVGYRKQVSLWPVSPVTTVLKGLTEDKRGRFLENKAKHIPGKISSQWVVADMGCGDGELGKQLKAENGNEVHSFDFTAPNDSVTAADMKHVPLENGSVDVVVFSLSLMSTDWTEYIVEAHRILKEKRLMKVVEVRSRLPDPDSFVEVVESLGFQCDWYGVMTDYFVCFDFIRREGKKPVTVATANLPHLPEDVLTPCLYKRR